MPEVQVSRRFLYELISKFDPRAAVKVVNALEDSEVTLETLVRIMWAAGLKPDQITLIVKQLFGTAQDVSLVVSRVARRVDAERVVDMWGG